MEIESIDIPGTTLATNDAEVGYYIYELDEPLAPGESTNSVPLTSTSMSS